MAVRVITLLAAALLAAGCTSNSQPRQGAAGTTAGSSTSHAPSTTMARRAPDTTITPSTTTSTTTSTGAATPYVPDGVDPDSPCLERAVFPDPSESPYLLPFTPGEWYPLTQSYCLSEGGHRSQLAYDFGMPIGRDVLAARAGVVKDLREDSPDDGRGHGEHNYVFVEHADGTVAFYAHLMRDGVLVEVGDRVEAGQVIALSGNSGMTGSPHLHFGVYRWWPPQEGLDVPVSFSNAAGRLDPLGGLIEGLVYEALPVE